MIAAESVTETQDVYRPNVSSYDTPQMREAPVAPKIALSIDTLSIFSGTFSIQVNVVLPWSMEAQCHIFPDL